MKINYFSVLKTMVSHKQPAGLKDGEMTKWAILPEGGNDCVFIHSFLKYIPNRKKKFCCFYYNLAQLIKVKKLIPLISKVLCYSNFTYVNLKTMMKWKNSSKDTTYQSLLRKKEITQMAETSEYPYAKKLNLNTKFTSYEN